MANKLSPEGNQVVVKFKRSLMKNNLEEFYRKIDGLSYPYVPAMLKQEISQFFITMGVDIFSYFEKVPKQLLMGAGEIRDIIIPGNCTSIESEAFSSSSIEALVLEEGVEVVGKEAFEDCKNLKAVDLGRVVTIKDGAFKGCDKLSEVYLPDSVQSMGKGVWPENVILKSPKRKKKSLRFPKSEMEWYRSHLVLDDSDPDPAVTPDPATMNAPSQPVSALFKGGEEVE